MIDQYKYTWKMVKPLIPIIFLAIWVVLFEDKIWPDWENEIPVKNFGRGEIQWEYDMNSEQAKENYRFEFIQLTGNDDNALEFNKRGGIGSISVTANIAPKLCSEFQALSLKTDDKSKKDAMELDKILQPLHSSMFVAVSYTHLTLPTKA